jgi:hypothetical protein
VSETNRRGFFGQALGGLLVAAGVKAAPTYDQTMPITLTGRNEVASWVEGNPGLRPCGPVTISGRYVPSWPSLHGDVVVYTVPERFR